jgi:hypothetical protein
MFEQGVRLHVVTCQAGRAAVPDVKRHTGKVLRVGDLAAAYGFTDIDGRVVPPFEVGG